MTFLEEDEVFPPISATDASASAAVADASVRENVNGSGEQTEVSCTAKRKLLEKPVDKKVSFLNLVDSYSVSSSFLVTSLYLACCSQVALQL